MLRRLALTGCVLFACLLDWLCLRPMLKSAIDFPQFYLGGQLVAHGNVARIYDTAAYEPLVKDIPIIRGKTGIYYNRPAFGALLCVPLALLPYQTSYYLFTLLNFALWALLIWKLPVWLNAPGHLRVWLICFFPFTRSVGYCQDTLAITLIMAYACYVLMPRSESRAGALLALCLVKPHLALLIPLFLFREGRRRALTAFIGAGSLLAALSFALVGTEGVRQWLALLQAPTTDLFPEVMGNIRALGIHFGAPAAIATAIVTVAAGVVVLARGNYNDKLSAIVLLTLLLSPHAYSQDYSLTALVALATGSTFTRYIILLPWFFFWPGGDLVPLVVSTIACLAWIAAPKLFSRVTWDNRIQRWRTGSDGVALTTQE
jgi:Glycosyltransferase family 87